MEHTIDRNAWRFFLNNAGYATPPGRVACAASLARAEAEARERGWYVFWEGESDIPYEDALGDHAYWCDREAKGERHQHTVEMATLVGPDSMSSLSNVLASLGAIIDADAAYRRVVAAELAAEALGQEQ